MSVLWSLGRVLSFFLPELGIFPCVWVWVPVACSPVYMCVTPIGVTHTLAVGSCRGKAV